MSIFDIFKVDKGDSPENLGKVVSDSAVDLIKQLSGNNIKRTKNVVDNIVIVSGASGGTGVSTIVSNVAHLVTKKGFKVLVIDLNILFPIQPAYLGVKQGSLDRYDLVSYLLGKSTIGDSIDTSTKVSVIYANNRSLMDLINCESDKPVENFKELLSKARQLYDLILIDSPMRIDNTLVNTAFYLADQVYLVWDEGLSSIANTEKIRRNMALSGIDSYTKTRIIFNNRTDIHYTDYPFQKLNLECIETLPFSTAIRSSGLRSEIFCDKGESSDENAGIFYEKLVSLSDKILRNGGWIG